MERKKKKTQLQGRPSIGFVMSRNASNHFGEVCFAKSTSRTSNLICFSGTLEGLKIRRTFGSFSSPSQKCYLSYYRLLYLHRTFCISPVQIWQNIASFSKSSSVYVLVNSIWKLAERLPSEIRTNLHA